MSRRNQLSKLHREVLSPLIGKIVSGFRFEPSPRRDLFSDKFTLRLRHLNKQDSELFLAAHHKSYGPPGKEQRVLNLGVHLLMTENIEHYTVMEGFSPEEQESLQALLRQPITGFHLTPEQTLVVVFQHQSLILERDTDENGDLHMAWTLNDNY